MQESELKSYNLNNKNYETPRTVITDKQDSSLNLTVLDNSTLLNDTMKNFNLLNKNFFNKEIHQICCIELINNDKIHVNYKSDWLVLHVSIKRNINYLNKLVINRNFEE